VSSDGAAGAVGSGGADIGPLASGLADAVAVGGEQSVVLGCIAFSTLRILARTASWRSGRIAAKRLGGSEGAVTKSALPIGSYGIAISVISPFSRRAGP
jgi:hypothetical protein